MLLPKLGRALKKEGITDRMPKSKKSQLSVFIVLGAMLLVTLGLIYYVQEIKSPEPKSKEYDENYVAGYIKECISQHSEAAIKELARKGGSFSSYFSRQYNNQSYSYFCLQRYGVCQNQLILRQDMEKELSKKLRKKAKQCINNRLFENHGITVNSTNISVIANIADKKTAITINGKIKIKKNKKEIIIEKLNFDIWLPLGELYRLAVEITNKELEQGYFDAIGYMLNSPAVRIEKHRPYPDIVYSLEKNSLVFNFAVQGTEDSYKEAEETGTGCCYNYYDRLCFKNTAKLLCSIKGGVYDYSKSCECPSAETPEKTSELSCKDGYCKSCSHTHDKTGKLTNLTRKHGESWCVYESPAGKSSDFVGSRHYVFYCYDGKEYIEECRDYREEICKEIPAKNMNSYKKNKRESNKTEKSNRKDLDALNIAKEAVCVPNKWQSCYSCKTEQCCENNELRDCSWDTKIHGCYPAVPPGLKFWQDTSYMLCSIANSIESCDSEKSCKKITKNSAVSCYKTADCGNYFNVGNNYASEGFISSAYSSTNEIDNEIKSLAKKQLSKYNENSLASLGYAWQKKPAYYNRPGKETQADILAAIISNSYSHLKQLAETDITSIAIANKTKESEAAESKSTKKIYNFCLPWQPPDGSKSCSKCSSQIFPCTEYKCKSLGKACLYSETNGIGKCSPIQKRDFIPPIVLFTEESLNKSHKLKKEELIINNSKVWGYFIEDKFEPYSLLEFSFNTTEKARCTLSYMPDKISSPAFSFSPAEYRKEHNISFRIPEAIAEKSSVSIISSIIEKLKSSSIHEPKDAKEHIKSLIKSIIPWQSSQEIEKLAKLTEAILKLNSLKASAISSNISLKNNETSYYIFIECKDIAGNKNKEKTFLHFIVKSRKSNMLPKVLACSPENNSIIAENMSSVTLKVFLDMPSECSYKISNSIKKMGCAEEPYELSADYKGSYICTTEMPVTKEKEKIKIECRKSSKKKSFSLAFFPDRPDAANSEKENSLWPFYTINTKNSITEINITSQMLATKKSFYAAGKEAIVNIFFESNYYCYYKSNNNIIKAKHTATKLNGLNGFINSIAIASENPANIEISCSREGIDNQKIVDFSYIIKKSEGLKIVDSALITENEAILSIRTTKSNGTECSYSNAKSSYNEWLRLKKITNSLFSAKLNAEPGENIYKIRCTDKYGNTDEKEISFYFSP